MLCQSDRRLCRTHKSCASDVKVMFQTTSPQVQLVAGDHIKAMNIKKGYFKMIMTCYANVIIILISDEYVRKSNRNLSKTTSKSLELPIPLIKYFKKVVLST